LKEHLAARRADLVLTVSESARRDLLAWFRLPEDRVRVVPEGPADVFGPSPGDAESENVLLRYGVDRGSRFFLYVGGLSPHKNLPRLIEGFARSALGREGFRLVLVGDTGDVFHTHVPELREAVTRHGLAGRVVFTGFVPDEDLVTFYSRAEALVQPSLMEGFGLPPVEAMACGTPVVSSTAGSLPEVVGDAGVFFDPTDVGRLAGALRRVVHEPSLRTDLAAKALRRASRFRWSETARAVLDAFESLAPAGLSPGAMPVRKESA
jgi:glycosyltransferase involved in cell wall biosynthesis